MASDKADLDFTREELEVLRRCSRYLVRVAAIFATKFGDNDRDALVIRVASATVTEIFERSTTPDERQEIERLLLLEDPLTRRWMDQRIAVLGDKPWS